MPSFADNAIAGISPLGLLCFPSSSLSSKPETMSDIPPSENSEPNNDIVTSTGQTSWSDLYRKEDWWAIWLGAIILTVGFLAVYVARPEDVSEQVAKIESLRSEIRELKSTEAPDEEVLKAKRDEVSSIESKITSNPLKPWLTKIEKWEASPLDAYYKPGKTDEDPPTCLFIPVLGVFVVCALLFGLGIQCTEGKGGPFL
ncbi:MAG: hypothetical protein KDA65_15460, partial [Planctomycetaceae bacterium]|nr:hypothetical protein [Planctomycetaceae bacterium]